ncbi:AMP-binding protein [Geodermatophilus sabuli]|uniref:AMP-binding protein n=1 Tax=Geodermatophilus sabuli TaxID=1564158 RepID=A0A7K3VW30_9ACTN|nr:AMP-binding protein [Geodermatophilus sabuli]
MAHSLRTVPPQLAERYRAEGWWRGRSLLEDFLEAVAKQPDKAAIVAYRAGSPLPTTLTYAQLGGLVDRLAGAMLDMGVEREDIISIQLPNGWEFPVIALAAQRAGAIPNPIPPIYRERELRLMLGHARSKLLFVPDDFRGFPHGEVGRRLQADLPTLQHVVVIGDESDTQGPRWTADLLGERRELDPALKCKLDARVPTGEDIALLLFTSGTTGMPKAALHTHDTLWASGLPMPWAMELTGDDVAFMASTLGHLTGFYWGMLLPLSTGQKVVYQDVWDAPAALDLIEQEKITWTLSATPFAQDLVDAQEKSRRPVTDLRAFACGGAQIPPALAHAVKEHLGAELISLWGCSEGGTTTIHRIGTPIEMVAASDGHVVPWQELRIVDEDLQPVATGESGRLQVRGPGVFVGYLDQPEFTADSMTSDGWFETGDLGRQVTDGGIRFTGRSKDIIVRGGQNVPVVETENILISHPQVADVTIVGYPDERLGERGCAVVVPAGAPPTLKDLTDHLAQAGMAKQFWPERLEIVDQLPRTASGKIQKYLVRARLLETPRQLTS